MTEPRPDPAERDAPGTLTTQQRIVLAIEHKQREPGQTAKFIAESVGLAPSTLSQSPVWQAAEKRVEESAADAPANGFRRDDGSLEAGEDAA